jgi:hypothetical protein
LVLAECAGPEGLQLAKATGFARLLVGCSPLHPVDRDLDCCRAVVHSFVGDIEKFVAAGKPVEVVVVVVVAYTDLGQVVASSEMVLVC